MERSDCLKTAEKLEEEGRVEDAISVLKECRDSYPDFLVGRLYLAKLLFKTGTSEDALQEVDYILSRSPNTLGALKLKGEILQSRGRLMEAKEIYLKVNFLDPFDEEVSRRLQEINEELEKAVRQETLKEEVPFDLEQTPSFPSEEPFQEEAEIEEGFSIPEEEKKEAPVPDLPEAQEEPFETESMALVLLKQGDFGEAERIYSKLAAKEPSYREKLKTVKIIKKLHQLLEEFNVQGKAGRVSQ